MKAALVAYLKAKVDAEDWHAVWDAAIDLAVLEAKEKALLHSWTGRVVGGMLPFGDGG